MRNLLIEGQDKTTITRQPSQDNHHNHGILSLLSLTSASRFLFSFSIGRCKREKGEDSMVDRTPRQTGSSFYQQLFSFIISWSSSSSPFSASGLRLVLLLTARCNNRITPPGTFSHWTPSSLCLFLSLIVDQRLLLTDCFPFCYRARDKETSAR